MRVLRSASHRRMPWRNGGGETIEIVVSPDGAGLDDFDWRVSMALVASDGPFSSFPGVDRTLSLLEGRGIILSVEGRVPLGLTRLHEPVSFPADVPTSASLIGGPITDLNVMSRRGQISHAVRFAEVARQANIETRSPHVLVLAVAGSAAFTVGAQTRRLAVHDALLLDAPAVVSLSASRRATVAVIEFRPI